MTEPHETYSLATCTEPDTGKPHCAHLPWGLPLVPVDRVPLAEEAEAGDEILEEDDCESVQYKYRSSAATKSTISLSSFSLDELLDLDALAETDAVASETEDKAERRAKKTVRFHKVQVYFHNMILGDNPSCSEGPPIGIGWKRVASLAMDLPDFEETRQMPYKTSRQLKISAGRRFQSLLNQGYTKKEIFRVTEELQTLACTPIQQRSASYPAPKVVGLVARLFSKRDKKP